MARAAQITAASTSALNAAFKELDVPWHDSGGGSAQLVAIDVICTGDPGASAFTLWAVLRDDVTVVRTAEMSCTVITNARSNGTSGGYLCSVSFTSGGTRNLLDLAGAGGVALAEGSKKMKWYVGCPAAALPNTGTVTAIDVFAHPLNCP